MGGNVWGGQSPAAIQFFTPIIGGADVACPAGTETNVLQQAAALAPNAGAWAMGVVGYLAIAMGATPPTAIIIGARIGAGADFDNTSVAVGVLVASATVIVPIVMNNPPTKGVFFPSGAQINITVNPTAQAVTVRNVGTRAILSLYRTMDF